MKKGASKNKGGAFERLICKKLSLWWTKDKRDDVFTRTASSGGRATQRSKKNKSTFGQYGDIQAADPIGQPLIDLCTIECKDGYATYSIADLMDKEPRHNPLYEQFIRQARKSNFESDSAYWLLIARRKGRQIMIFMPETLWSNIMDYKATCDYTPMINMSFHLQNVLLKKSKKKKIRKYKITGTTLDCFLNNIKPQDIKTLNDFLSK
jgi:hypothetical protein